MKLFRRKKPVYIIDLTQRLSADIDKIAAEHGITREEVFERAIRQLTTPTNTESR